MNIVQDIASWQLVTHKRHAGELIGTNGASIFLVTDGHGIIAMPIALSKLPGRLTSYQGYLSFPVELVC